MLQLFAGEDQPRTKQAVHEIGVRQGKEHVVNLENQGHVVGRSRHGIPGVPGLDEQPGYFFCYGLVFVIRIFYVVHALLDKCNGGPR